MLYFKEKTVLSGEKSKVEVAKIGTSVLNEVTKNYQYQKSQPLQRTGKVVLTHPPE